MQSQLLAKTQELVKSRKWRVLTVVRETGLPQSWTYDFFNDKIEKPNVIYIETLYVYLSGKPLQL